MGIIESLSAGYNTVTRRIWVIAIPVIIDLFLWLGVQLSIEPLIRGWVTLIESTPLPGDFQALPEGGVEALIEMGQQYNLLSLIKSPGQLMQTGSSGWLMPAVTSAPARFSGLEPSVVQLDSLGMVLLISAILLLVGLLISTLYLCFLAQVIRRQEGEPLLPTWDTVKLAWRRLLVYNIGLVILLVMLGVPLGLMLGVVAVTGQSFIASILNFALLVFMWLWLWLMLYLFFTVNAIVLNRVGVWHGIWTSVQVVARNFWPTVGLFLTSSVIVGGTTVIWQQIVRSPWGVLASIIGDGFIRTGVVAASLIFFRARFNQLVEAATVRS